MDNLIVSWETFKAFVIERKVSPQFIISDNKYYIVAFDASFKITCVLQNDGNLDLIDFQNNFLSNSNKKLGEPRDSDGSILSRNKITTTGWHYQLHGIEFESSKLNSVYSKKTDGTDYGFSSMKFYKLQDSNEVEITGDDLNQEFIDLNCVKTIVDWEPTHDLEVIGGILKQKLVPTEDVRLWVIGVPDVPAIYGGSKPFVVNVNLGFIGTEEGVKVDGRAPKYMQFSAINHTSKLRMMFRHPAGYKHKMSMIFELFKA